MIAYTIPRSGLGAVIDGVEMDLECRARDRVGAYGGLEPERDRVVGDRARRVAARHLLAPAPELPALDRRVDAPLAAEIRDVVHGPAEGVHRAERLATRARQREKRVVEVRAALPCEPGGEVRDHRALT